MAIVGNNTLLNQYVPSFTVKGPVSGDVLMYDSTRQSFVNVPLEAEPETPEVAALNLSNQLESVIAQTDGKTRSYTLPWITANPKSILVTLGGLEVSRDDYRVTVLETETQVKFSGPLPAGKKLEITGLETANAAGVKGKQVVLDEVTRELILPFEYKDGDLLIVTINGIFQQQGAFNIIDNKIVFSEDLQVDWRIGLILIPKSSLSNVSLFETVTEQAESQFDIPWVTLGKRSLIVLVNGQKISDDAYMIVHQNTYTTIVFTGIISANSLVQIHSLANLRTTGELTPNVKLANNPGGAGVFGFTQTIQNRTTAHFKSLHEGAGITLKNDNDKIVIENDNSSYSAIEESCEIPAGIGIVGLQNERRIRLLLPTKNRVRAGKKLVIKDETGEAEKYTTVIETADGSKIDGQQQYILNKNYGFVEMVFNGKHWFIIGEKK